MQIKLSAGKHIFLRWALFHTWLNSHSRHRATRKGRRKRTKEHSNTDLKMPICKSCLLTVGLKPLDLKKFWRQTISELNCLRKNLRS